MNRLLFAHRIAPVLTALAGFSLSLAPATAQIYVDRTAAGASNGSSWADAYTDLGIGLLIARLTGTPAVYVAQGTYKPGTSRDASFHLSNVTVVGGFPSGGGTRNVAAYPTILSGDIGVVGDSTDNCYHVVEISAYSTAGLNGLIIERGEADGASGSIHDSRGGGIWMNEARLALQECIIRDNRCSGLGAGLYIGGSQGARGLNAFQCAFYNNTGVVNGVCYGGGAYIASAAGSNSIGVRFNRTHFGGNSASYGGGVYVANGAEADFANSVFTGNTSRYHGGGLYVGTGASIVRIINNTFTANTAGTFAVGYGGGIWGGNASMLVANNALWGNIDARGAKALSQVDPKGGAFIQYNCIQGLTLTFPVGGGIGNFKASPGFVDADGADNIYGTADDNVSLRATSSLIDAGDSNYVTAAAYSGWVGLGDFSGGSRRVDVAGVPDTGIGGAPVVDVGAQERD